MTKTKFQKKEIVKDLADKADKSKAIIFTDYQGLKVKDITSLRKKLKKEKIDFQVVKNTLIKLALEKSDKKIKKVSILEEKGPRAVVFSYEDEVKPARDLYLFSLKHKELKILGGILDSKELKKAEILSLALLPTKQELLAKVVGSIGAPISGFVNALAGNLRNLVYVLQAIVKNN